MKKINLLFIFLFLSVSFYAQSYHINENFNNSSLPNGWTNTAVTGSQSWNFGNNGATAHVGNQNLNGTAMAYFDDDALGSTSTNNTASLTSPVFNNLNLPTTLEFDYNLRTLNGIADSFYVDVFDGTNWNRVFSRNMNDCGNYIQATCVGNFPHANIDISAFANTSCQVRFTYHDGNDWGWYIGLDNVQIYSPYQHDLKISEIISPVSDCGLNQSHNIIVEIKNCGTSTATRYDVVFDINNGSQFYHDTINANLLAGDSLQYTFISPANFLATGSYNVKAYTIYSSDLNPSNDTLIKIITNKQIQFLNYYDGFEGANIWLVEGANASWSRGTPNNTIISAAAAGSNAYVTNLSGDYNPNENSFLVSPCIDLSSNVDPILEFKLIYNTENNIDNLLFQSSTNQGATWQDVMPSPTAQNWPTSGGNWSGNSNGWINVRNTLIGLGGNNNVIFRFKFNSDASANLEGVGIDEFHITQPLPFDLTSKSLIYPSSSGIPFCGLGNENIIIELENYGSNTIDTIYACYSINNGPIFCDSIYNANILPANSINYTFSNQYNFAGSISNNIDFWATTPNDGLVSNDSIKGISILNNNNSPTTANHPFFEDFESFTLGSADSNGWSANPSTGNAHRWQADELGTPSFNTGPDHNHTPNGSKYMYAETSGGNGTTASLETPCIDLSLLNGAILEFWYHKFGASMGTLFIDVYDGANWNLGVDNIPGQTQSSSSDTFLLRTINLNAFIGNRIKVRFRSFGHTSFTGDMAIDDVSISGTLITDLSENNDIQNNLILFPNPNKGKFSIKIDNELVNKTYQIFNISGNLIQEGRLENKLNQINIENSSKGIYLMKIQGINEMKKVVVY